MKIEIESNDLLAIADEIEHNCTMLGFTDGEDAEDDLSFYVPVIRDLAERLRSLVALKEKQTGEPTQKDPQMAELMEPDGQRAFHIKYGRVTADYNFRKG